MNRRLPLLSLLVLASACGHAAGAGGGTGAPPGSGPGSVGTGPPRAVHIRAISLHAGVAADGAYARIGWWGGIPSCQGVATSVGRRDSQIIVTLTPTDVAPPGTACPDVAMRRTTRVSLGSLPTGTYTVRAGGQVAQLVVA
jgi:hypothetical protein